MKRLIIIGIVGLIITIGTFVFTSSIGWGILIGLGVFSLLSILFYRRKENVENKEPYLVE